jgi:hypothetical protein
MSTRPRSGHRNQQPQLASPPDAVRFLLKVLAVELSPLAVFQRVPKKALASDTVHATVERALDTRERCLSSTLSLAVNRWRRSRNGRPTSWFGRYAT